ncbi:MAG: PA0069 family radical SAM protein [Elusimicrobia bacterium]|nr:PA0069 family radical SAM protein [Elusimicrobiota bacterium]
MLRKIINPPSPYDCQWRELLEEPPPVELEYFEEPAKSILSENKSPDLSFRWSLNPYRGCFHACAYCYARPSHEYLGFGAGTDFESKIVVKPNAPELLRQTFEKSSWPGELIVFSGDTDCYQPAEAIYGLTRKCLEACLEYRNPVSIITKSRLILRDEDILRGLRQKSSVHVTASLAFADDDMARKVEPQAPSPSKRFEMIKGLAQAGISVSVLMAPIIPGLNDAQIPEVLRRAREAGAQSAGMVILRLPCSVQQVFQSRMAEQFPDRIKKIENFLKTAKNGVLNRGSFHERYEGHGEYWNAIQNLFTLECRRLGLNNKKEKTSHPPTFHRPSELFSSPFS